MNEVRPAGSGVATSLGPLLFTVDAVFMPQGRPGPLLAPGIPHVDTQAALAVGTALVLVTPDGLRTVTHITGIELLHPGTCTPPIAATPICVSADIATAQIPRGTRVHLAGPA